MTDEVKAKWMQLCSRYTSALQIEELWSEIEQAFSSKGRYYHNLNHLAFMLQLAEQYKQEAQHPDALLFAIFYHDIVYSPTSGNNEEESAALAQNRLSRLGIEQEELDLVKAMILATKKHQSHQSTDINLLLDFDLAILGTEWEVYDTYRKQVRKEYSHVPDALYRNGRKQVLQRFLDQPSIFKTPPFQEKLEAKARLNLEKEVTLLH